MGSTTVQIPNDARRFWSEEETDRPGFKRMRARIGGLHCSLCTGTIEQALGRQQGVEKVSVSLTHEQALVEYETEQTTAEQITKSCTIIKCPLLDGLK